MSDRLFPEDVIFFQRLLSADGLYKGRLDGVWGPVTEAAAQAFEQQARSLRESLGCFDPRSERHIATLSLRAQAQARRFLARLDQSGLGLRARIVSGTRSYAEQTALYRQGRFGNAGAIVTHAKAGASAHHFGIAWDIALFTPEGGYITDEAAYDQAAAQGLCDALEWGGHWSGFADRPHYQLRLGVSVPALRLAFEAGQAQTAFA